jgi:hypothetical protein
VKEKKWGMTENGVLVPKDTIDEAQRYMLKYVDNSINSDILLDYRELIRESESKILKKTIDFFAETWSDLPISSMTYLNKENELHILLKNNTRILFTLQDFTKKTGEIQSYKHIRMQLL